MHASLKVLLPLAALLALTGCRSTYLLSSKFVVNSQAEKPPEVVESATYLTQHSQLYTVAVRAPDGCSNQTSASATGDARASGTILKTECGVEMAELERALTKKGYRVISWKVLAREVAGGKTAAEVASTLGAEVLFQINSLEKSEKSLGKDARWERNYFLSDAYGAKLGEQAFDEVTRRYLRDNYLAGAETRLERSGLRQPSVTLDANAILVATGESIWYYQWTHADASRFDMAPYEVLVSCKGERECIPLRALSQEKKVATETRSSGDSDAVSVSERPEDILAAQHAALLSDVIKSLVESFSKGQTIVRPVAPPPPLVPVAAPVLPEAPAAPAAPITP